MFERLGGKNYNERRMLSFPSATAFLFWVSSKETQEHMENVAENKLNRFTKGWYLKEDYLKHKFEIFNLKLKYIFIT